MTRELSVQLILRLGTAHAGLRALQDAYEQVRFASIADLTTVRLRSRRVEHREPPTSDE